MCPTRARWWKSCIRTTIVGIPPYTFSNVLKKYTPWRLDGLWFFNRISLLALLSKLPGNPPLE